MGMSAKNQKYSAIERQESRVSLKETLRSGSTDDAGRASLVPLTRSDVVREDAGHGADSHVIGLLALGLAPSQGMGVGSRCALTPIPATPPSPRAGCRPRAFPRHGLRLPIDTATVS